MQTTVPMLRGVWGASLKGCRNRCTTACLSGRSWHAAVCDAARAAGSSPGAGGRVPPVWAAQPAGRRYRLGSLGSCLPQRTWVPAASFRPARGSSAGLGWHPVEPQPAQPGFALFPLPWPAGDPSGACRLEFPAPLRLIYRGRLVERPTLADVTIAALRRVQSLAPASADALWPDRHAWLDAARQVPCEPWQGKRLDLVRYSGSQKRELELRGVSGSLLLPEGPGPLAALLAASSWLHLGKGTVMGLGQLQITTTLASI